MITSMSLARLVPWGVHCAIEYVAALLLIAAPFLFGFERDAAKWTSVALGVVLLVAVLTRGPLGVTKSLAASAHATLDVLAVVLVLTPFVLGFAGDKAAVTFFVLLGVAHAALSLLTRFPEKATAA